MLVDPVLPYRERRRRAKWKAAETPGPAGPVLVGAAFVTAETTYVRLTFDVDVTLTSEDFGAAITVTDGGGTGRRWAGDTTVSYPAADAFEFGLRDDGYVAGDGTRLTVTDASGIAGTDGVLWAGVSELALPFGTGAAVRTRDVARRRSAAKAKA